MPLLRTRRAGKTTTTVAEALTPKTLQVLLRARLKEAFAATVIQAAGRRCIAIAAVNHAIAECAAAAVVPPIPTVEFGGA